MRISDRSPDVSSSYLPRFEVEGRNIVYPLPVAPWEAARGATISVPTLGGKVELKIPAGSEAGRKLRLRGRGLPNGNSAAGDQIVELEVQAPAPEGDAQREAYGTLRDAFAGKRSEEHTSELQSLMRISYAVFCLKKKKKKTQY